MWPPCPSLTHLMFSLLLLAGCLAQPAQPASRECRTHPCGWVHYTQRSGVWSASGVQPNTFCSCPVALPCRHDTTQTARTSHSVIQVYRCQGGEAGGATFPGRLATRQHIPWAAEEDTLS